MALIGLLAVGFLGGAFMIYALVGLSRALGGFQWTPGDAPKPIRPKNPKVIARLDIFKFDPDGNPVWKGTAIRRNLGSAELSVKVKVVAFDSPAEYVIYSQDTGKKTA